MKTKDKLTEALQEANAPQAMIDRARQGYYDDFETTIADPIRQLIIDALAFGLEDIAKRAAEGDFDGTDEEGRAWFESFVNNGGLDAQ